jgi:hypothetical protein
MPKKSSKISVVATTPKSCKPFLLNVMVMAPEANYKFEVMVEKACTSLNEAVWKLVFDLYKKKGSELLQIVHVSFTAGSDDEEKGLKRAALIGLTESAVKALKTEVYPVAKQVGETGGVPTQTQQAKLAAAMSKAAKANVKS